MPEIIAKSGVTRSSLYRRLPPRPVEQLTAGLDEIGAGRAMSEASDRMKDMTNTALALPVGYADFLCGLEARVRDAQIRAQRGGRHSAH
jgi:hypothetical protein